MKKQIKKMHATLKITKMKNFITTFCLLVLTISNITAGSIITTLKGEVIDRPQSRHVMLGKRFECLESRGIEIPIVNGKFEHILNSEHEEEYWLVFSDEWEDGAFIPIRFFSESATIYFTLYPKDRAFEENKIEGGKLSMEFWDYNNRMRNISNEVYAILEQISEEIWDSIRDICHKKMFQLRLQYIKENPTLVGYSILLSEVWHAEKTDDISSQVDLYRTVFAPKFPNHPYTEQIERLLNPLIVAGTPFVDFTAPDLNGNLVKLSERIAGKPAVLHLWASWCGPCLRMGRELIPIYEEFRNKGFVVIGVAHERDVSNAVAAVERLQFPWENLVDLRGAQKIWEKYELRAAGLTYLIDENGIIVAIHPTAEEVRDFLVNKFQ